MTADERWWLVADFGPGAGLTYGFWVQARDAAEAAAEGRAALKQENSSDDQDYCEMVVVLPAGESQWRWFTFDAVPRPAALQCCGGAPTADGHSGFCHLPAGERRERKPMYDHLTPPAEYDQRASLDEVPGLLERWRGLDVQFGNLNYLIDLAGQRAEPELAAARRENRAEVEQLRAKLGSSGWPPTAPQE